MLQIPHELLEIRNTGGHLIGETLDGNDFNSGIDVAEFVENRHFGADVIDLEGVFAELDFNAEPSLQTIPPRRNLVASPHADFARAFPPFSYLRKLQRK